MPKTKVQGSSSKSSKAKAVSASKATKADKPKAKKSTGSAPLAKALKQANHQKKTASTLQQASSSKEALAKAKKSADETKKPVAVAVEVAEVAVMVEVEAPAPAKKAKGTRKTKAEKLEEQAEKTGQMTQKWNSLFKKSNDQETKPYNMRHVYEAKTGIQHKLLGWGYILNNKNDRLEVLFQDGIRFLISNYKA